MKARHIQNGHVIYYSATAGKVTTTSTSNTLIGYAFEAAGTGASKVKVKLNS